MSDEEVYFGEVRQFWQTDQLYRVEGARRALAAARAEAEAARFWREDLARREAERRVRVSAEVERRRAWAQSPEGVAAEAADRQALEAEKARRLASFRKEQKKLAVERKKVLPARAVWMAWRYAQGGTQAEAGEELGLSSSAVSMYVRMFIEAHLPEELTPPARLYERAYIRGDRRELLRRHFAGKDEPLLEDEASLPAATRDDVVYRERRQGRGFAEIGEELGISRSRAAGIYKRVERQRLEQSRKAAVMALWRRDLWELGRRNLGRPIDMGGARDVWLEFTVPPDPRADSMVAVGVSG